MAVTVTKAVPDKNTDRHWTGDQGVRNADTFINAPDARQHRVRVVGLNLSGTYATNGFALTPSDYGLQVITGLAVICDGKSGGAALPYLSTAGASPIVKLVTDNVPTELANATSVTNHSYTVVLFGT